MANVNSRSLYFDGCFPVECSIVNKGRYGGLCMLWKGNIDVSLITFSDNHISIEVAEAVGRGIWQLSGIYGWSSRSQRTHTFQLFRRVAPMVNLLWLCIGDMNEIMWTWEK
ncbi:hypothetical protein ACS0TY_014347 [Phlomoides rotata]